MGKYRSLSSHLSSALLKAGARRATRGDAHRIRRRRFYLHSYAPEHGWAPHATVPCVDLDAGRLFVNGVQIVAPTISRDHLSWQQHSRIDGREHYTSGVLFLHSSGLEAHGVVAFGPSPATARHCDVLGTVIPTVTYTTQVTRDHFAASTCPGSVPAGAWAPGLELQITYQQQLGSSVPTPVVLLDGQDVSDRCSWSVDEQSTILTFNLADVCVLCPQLYASATLTFSAYEINAPGVGAVSRLCSEPLAPVQAAPSAVRAGPAQGADPKVYLWKAQCVTTPSAVAHPAVLHEPARLLLNANHVLDVDPSLSPGDLMTMLPDDVVNSDANSMLMRNMKWAMGQDSTQNGWLAQFFGERAPVIVEADQQNLVRQSLSWYQQKFAMAYLTQSFNSYTGPNAPSHVLNEDQSARLAEFLKSGLANDKDFNVQHQGIFVDAYVGTKPRLQAYLGDTSSALVGWAQGSVVFARAAPTEAVTIPAGTLVQTALGVGYVTLAAVTLAVGQSTSAPVAVEAAVAGDQLVSAGTLVVMPAPIDGVDTVTNLQATTLAPDSGGMRWAKELFTTLTTGAQFVLMVNRVAGAAGDPKALGPLNNFACLLTVLDRSGTLAARYFQSVISGVIVKLAPQVTHSDADTIMQWLPATMAELLRQLADGELPNEADLSREEAKEIYQEFLKHQSEVSLALADLFQSLSASGLLDQVNKAEQGFETKIAAKWPKLARASQILLALGWVGAVTCVIVALTKGEWSSMTEVERAEFATEMVQLAVTGFDAVPLLWQGTRYLGLKTWNGLSDWWNGKGAQKAIELKQKNATGGEESAVSSEADEMNTLIAKTSGNTLGEASGWARIFGDGILQGSLKCLGALLAAAMAAYSLWQLIDDLKHNATVTTKVFDSLVFAANFLAAACLVVDLFVATSFLPIAGALLAIAGIIIGIIAGFYEKPDNPVDDWMVDNGIPFATGLPAVPAT